MLRLLVIALALATIGLLVLKQPGSGLPARPAGDAGRNGTGAPAVPARLQDLKSFSHDLNRFIGNAAERQRREIDRTAH